MARFVDTLDDPGRTLDDVSTWKLMVAAVVVVVGSAVCYRQKTEPADHLTADDQVPGCDVGVDGSDEAAVAVMVAHFDLM